MSGNYSTTDDSLGAGSVTPPGNTVVLVDAPRELAAAMAESRELRELIREICDAVEAISARAGMRANVATWRRRAGLVRP